MAMPSERAVTVVWVELLGHDGRGSGGQAAIAGDITTSELVLQFLDVRIFIIVHLLDNDAGRPKTTPGRKPRSSRQDDVQVQ